MRIVVDLAWCQSVGQCVFAAPEIFELRGQEVFDRESAPATRPWPAAERARAAWTVQAIPIGPAAGEPADLTADAAANRTRAGRGQR